MGSQICRSSFAKYLKVDTKAKKASTVQLNSEEAPHVPVM